MPQACRAPQDPQVSKEREVPLVSPEPLDVLGWQVSNGHGAGLMFPCAHPHQPPGQSWHSRARASVGLWELSVSREKVVISRDCVYPGKAGRRVMGQSVYRDDARTDFRHRGTFVQVENVWLGDMNSMFGGGEWVQKC